MTQATKTRKQTEINAGSIARVNSKSGEFLGYLVKSNSTEDYYQVTYNTSANRYECNCAAFSRCCHLRAVEEVQAIRFAKPVARGEAPVCSELKTVFSSIEEEYEYRLHAYGKKSAVHWAYEQKQHTEVSVVPSGQAEEVATVASHERDGQLPQETRQKIYNWVQSQAGDEMEREYNETAVSKVLVSRVCGHRVNHDVNRSCGCDA